MTTERWEQVERTYRDALERDPPARAAFLDDASGDDSELRRQVQSLLENSAEVDSLLERPAMELVAKSMAVEPPHVTAGQRLETYELLLPIGAGGMGEVWRARDPALGREVAIKFLAGAYAQDTERLRRFEPHLGYRVAAG